MALGRASLMPLRLQVAAPKCRSPLPATSSSVSFTEPPPYRLQWSRRLIAGGLSTALLSPFFFFVTAPALSESPPPTTSYVDDFEEEEQRVVHLFEEATRSVVCIKDVELVNAGAVTASSSTNEGINVEGTGSGFVWDTFGHIVTNYHVISKLANDITGKQQTQVSILDPNGEVVVKVAQLVGADPTHDLAVLKIDIPGNMLQPLPLGSSKRLRVGQSSYAIGNPYGYEHTLTSGVISGLGREIPSPAGRPIAGAIQTDTAINAGNSGGPLLDSAGHVIGINTATFTRQGTGMSSGVNFAIPIDVVLKLVPYLIVNGTIPY